jgi:LacI family transcriptional regulator
MSLKKIQKLTGFSPSTISRVLNNNNEFRFHERTRRIILEAADEIDYRPNSVARSLRLKKTMIIGLIVSDIKNSFFGELASWIEMRLREHGYSTILYDTNEDPENEEHYLRVLAERRVDGIIITPTHTGEWDLLRNIKKEIPVVLVDRIFNDTDIPWVTGDNVQAAEKVTYELISLGNDRIAYLGGAPDTYINQVRYTGYKRALEKKGLGIDSALIAFQGYSVKAGREMMEAILSSELDFTAALCVNNLVFLGAMSVLQEKESSYENPVLMAAFDIGQYCALLRRPILCANQNIEVMANSAVGLLLDRIDNHTNGNEKLIIPIPLVKHCIGDPRSLSA